MILQDHPNGSPTRELEETTRAGSPYQVAEHHPVRPESLQPHTEWSGRPGSEPPSVEAFVYTWRYALLVVHARKEEEGLHTQPYLAKFCKNGQMPELFGQS